jgi:hypothetical protein
MDMEHEVESKGWCVELPESFSEDIYEDRRELAVELLESTEQTIRLDSLIEGAITETTVARALGALTLIKDGFVEIDPDNIENIILTELGKRWAKGLQILSPKMMP